MRSSALSTLRRLLPICLPALALCAGNAARGYALIGGSWPTGTIPMQLQLDATAPASPTLPLTDGTASWNALATAAMSDWNAVLVRSKFSGTVSTSTTAKFADGVSSIFFSNTIYGSTFDQYTLAVTIVDHYDNTGRPSVRTREADLIVNNGRTWNSYRGAIHSNPVDLRRVLVHELGHVLGLDHPDKADPVQTVASIMNSTVSGIEALQTDDINGVNYLYGSALTKPTMTYQATDRTAATTDTTSFSVGLDGVMSPAPKTALRGYVWYFQAAGTNTYQRLDTDNSGTLNIGTVQAADAGSYYVQVVSPDTDKTVQTGPAVLTVSPITTAPATTLFNVSTRGQAGSGSSTMIAGFVIRGSKPKRVLLRAVGPTLASTFQVPGTLADPVLTLVDASGKTLATSNSGAWDSGTDATDIRNSFVTVGAFGLQAGSNDAVILTSVPPGSGPTVGYTALVTSKSGNNTGVVLLEAYDVDKDTTNPFINLSTRGYVGTGSNIMIAGFSVQGPGPHTYLIRVSGKSLEQAPWNVTGTVIDPILTLFKSQPDGSSVQLRVDDDWDNPSASQPALSAAFQSVGTFAYPYPSTVNGVRDDTAMQPAMIVTLQPGNYTAQASGNPNDGSTSPTGNALIEVFEMH